MCLVMCESGSAICAAVGGGSLTSLLIVLAQGDVEVNGSGDYFL